MNNAPVVKENDVLLACAELEKSVDELNNVLDNFQSRLQKITRQEPVAEAICGNTGDSSACELSGIIRSQKHRLNSMINRIVAHDHLLEI